MIRGNLRRLFHIKCPIAHEPANPATLERRWRVRDPAPGTKRRDARLSVASSATGRLSLGYPRSRMRNHSYHRSKSCVSRCFNASIVNSETVESFFFKRSQCFSIDSDDAAVQRSSSFQKSHANRPKCKSIIFHYILDGSSR